MKRVELELPEVLIGRPEPLVVNLPRVSVPELVEADWILMLQKLRIVIIRPCLVHSLTMDQDLTKVGKAGAQVHVVRLVRLVASTVGAGQAHHLLDHLAVEDHAAASGRVIVPVGAVSDPEAVPLTDGDQLIVVVDVVAVVAGEQVEHLADAKDGVVVGNDKPLPVKQKYYHSMTTLDHQRNRELALVRKRFQVPDSKNKFLLSLL